jgi:hypothetical protein
MLVALIVLLYRHLKDGKSLEFFYSKYYCSLFFLAEPHRDMKERISARID